MSFSRAKDLMEDLTHGAVNMFISLACCTGCGIRISTRPFPIVMLTPNQFSTIPTRFSLPPWIARTSDSIEFLPERILDHDPDAEAFDFAKADVSLGVGAEVERMRVPAWRPNTHIEDAGEITPRVALENARPIHATLERLADYVKLILSSV